MIKFKTLKLKNFRSYEKLELDNFNEMGLTLISGTNGTGKSTIRQAIEYLLIDATSENLPMDELPKDSGKDCRLECELEMPNGDEIRITKYRNDTKMGNKIILEINGDDTLTTSDRRITKKNVAQVLGLTPELLFSSTMFSQDSPSFVESTEKDRKDILYNFIDRNAYDKLLDRAKYESDELEIVLDNLMDERNADCVRLEKVREQLAQVDYHEKAYKDEVWDEIKHLERKKEEIKLDDDTFLKKEIKRVEEALKDVPDQELSSQLYDQEQDLITLIERNSKKLGVYEAKLNDIRDNKCPVLGSPCEILTSKKEAVQKEYKPLWKTLSKEREKLVADKKVILNQQKELREKELTYEHYQGKLRGGENQLQQLKHHNSQIAELRAEIDEEIKQREDGLETNRFALMRKQAETEIEDFVGSIALHNESLDQAQKEKEYYEFWVKGFSRAGIPNMKMEGILASLEGETNNYLSKVSDSIFVEIDAQSELKSSAMKEKISYTVNHPEKTIKAYRSYSGGERQRVKLSDIFAFNSLLGKFDIMILDEVLEGSIDDTGKSMIISLLKEKSKELGSLLVVSHDDYIKDSFDSVLKATKTNGVSSIGR